LTNLSSLPELDGSTLELSGVVPFSHKELEQLVSLFTFRPVSNVPELPKSLARFLSRVSQLAWWPSFSPDELERRFISNPDHDPSEDWAKVGVSPKEIEDIAISILRRYRSG
jgi:NADH dehydrogenase (ubiquinone) 1 alpha subcomplex subunit 9